MHKINLPTIILSFISYFIGEYWNLLLIYLTLNITDTILGTLKAKKANEISSTSGIKGITKKLYQWLLIFLSFSIATVFEKIGEILNINFSISIFLGWYVYTYFIINEFRSIIENLIQLGCNVPKLLIDGLEAANKVITKNEKSDRNE